MNTASKSITRLSEIALYAEQKLPKLSDLIKWAAFSQSYLSEFEPEIKPEDLSDVRHFMFALNYFFIGGLIEDPLSLEISLSDFLETANDSHEGTIKKCVGYIGQAFMKSCEKYLFDEEHSLEYLKTLNVFMSLGEQWKALQKSNSVN